MTNPKQSPESIRRSIKDFILAEFLPGVPPHELTDETPLISGGILDSLATIRLVAHIEKAYGVEVAAHETGADYLNTLNSIADLVQAKLGIRS